jgi:hypothetical protein
MRHQKDNMYGSFFRPFGNVSKITPKAPVFTPALVGSWRHGQAPLVGSWRGRPRNMRHYDCAAAAGEGERAQGNASAPHTRGQGAREDRGAARTAEALCCGIVWRCAVGACVRARSLRCSRAYMRVCVCVCLCVRARSIAWLGGEMNRLAGDAGERCGSECARAGTQEKSRSRAHQCGTGAE